MGEELKRENEANMEAMKALSDAQTQELIDQQEKVLAYEKTVRVQFNSIVRFSKRH